MKQSILLAVTIAVIPAIADGATSRKSYVRHSYAVHSYAVPAPVRPGTDSWSPPRMIEIRPGYWVSSWGCVIEDAQGRLKDCAVGGGVR